VRARLEQLFKKLLSINYVYLKIEVALRNVSPKFFFFPKKTKLAGVHIIVLFMIVPELFKRREIERFKIYQRFAFYFEIEIQKGAIKANIKK